MGNNLFIDVSTINANITNVDRLMEEAKKAKYWVAGSWCSPLHIDTATKPLKMEASALSYTNFSGWKSNKLSYTYHFKNSFTTAPIVTVTYDGFTAGVTTRILHVTGTSGAKGKDSVTFLLHAPSNTTWSKGKDKFYLHFIAVGH
jgi:hypothetical protein